MALDLPSFCFADLSFARQFSRCYTALRAIALASIYVALSQAFFYDTLPLALASQLSILRHLAVIYGLISKARDQDN